TLPARGPVAPRAAPGLTLGNRRFGATRRAKPPRKARKAAPPSPRRLTRTDALFITMGAAVLHGVDGTMGLVANIRRDLRFAKGLRRLLKRIKPIDLDSTDLVCDDWEEAVDRFPEHVALQDDRLTLTYRELDAMANRFGHWAQSR